MFATNYRNVAGTVAARITHDGREITVEGWVEGAESLTLHEHTVTGRQSRVDFANARGLAASIAERWMADHGAKSWIRRINNDVAPLAG